MRPLPITEHSTEYKPECSSSEQLAVLEAVAVWSGPSKHAAYWAHGRRSFLSQVCHAYNPEDSQHSLLKFSRGPDSDVELAFCYSKCVPEQKAHQVVIVLCIRGPAVQGLPLDAQDAVDFFCIHVL